MSHHYSNRGLLGFLCKFPGCNRGEYAKELCFSHYAQNRKGKGLTALYSVCRPRGTPPRIRYDEVPCPNANLKGPCHIFLGSKSKKGYGQICLNHRMMPTHRYIWERDVGPIPSGMMIDHQCRNRACCNVDHLRVVTPKINASENVVRQTITHCPQGHPYDKDNTGYKKSGTLVCKECDRCRSREYQRKKRQEALKNANTRS